MTLNHFTTLSIANNDLAMAALRGRAQPAIGSAQWIQDENAQVALFCGQEAEDFACSARNEVEWLNEHMAEILSQDQMHVMSYSQS